MRGTIIIVETAPEGSPAAPWPRHEAECLDALSPAEVIAAPNAEAAAEAAREAALLGVDKIVAAGSDAIAHGVVNALMTLAEVHRREIKLGLLSLRRPQEWSRTIGFPRPLMRQLEVLKAGHTMPFDVGRVECLDCEGNPITRHFLNGACFGLTTELRGAWDGPGGEPRHRLEGLARVLRVLKERGRSWVSLTRDGQELYRGPIVAGLVMVGRFYPGLGEVAPNAEPGDGALDLVGLTGKLGPAELGWLARLRPGWVGASRRWTTEQGAEFIANDIAGVVRLELDGVPTGRLPARFSVWPRQIQVIVPAVPARVMKPAFQPLPAVAKRAAVAGNLRVN